MEAEFVDFDGQEVILLRNGTRSAYKLDQFSDADQTFLREWREKRMRTWHSTKGQEVEAELIDCDGKTARLRGDNWTRTFPLNSFTEEDRAVLQEFYDKQMVVPTGIIRNKAFTRHFNDYFESTDQKEWKKRYAKTEPDVDLEALQVIDADTDCFDIYVPSHCRADKPFGIYVHIPPGDGPMLPGYNQIFDEADIIAASPRNAGNGKDGFRRTVLVLACIETLKDQYLIDENRVYAGGLSGGGIVSFIIHLLYPDVVKGSISHARGVGLEDRPTPDRGGYYPSEVPYLSRTRLGRIARLNHRWVFISGDKDFNHEHIVAGLPVWKECGFDVRFLDIEGMGHSNAPQSAFKEALEWVDAAPRR